MGKSTKTYCNDCENDTNQTVLFSKKIVRNYERNVKILASTHREEYMVVQCKGCNTISFVQRLTGDGFFDDENNRNYIDINFPEMEHDKDIALLSFQEQRKLPRQLSILYEEVAAAFDQDSNLLAGIGLRMLVEAICLEQKIQGMNLKVKIEQMHLKGLISKNEILILDKLREIGNISAHKIKSISINKLEYALEILNHVLKSVYILPEINRKIKL